MSRERRHILARRAAAAGLFMAATALSPSARALNQLESWSFETVSEPGNAWSQSSWNPQTAHEDSFQRVAGGYQGSLFSFSGSWSAPTGQNNLEAHRYIFQVYTPPADQNAKLSWAYKRSNSGGAAGLNLWLEIWNVVATTQQHAGSDATWQTGSASVQPLIGGTSYFVRALWEVWGLNAGASQGASVDNIRLNVAPIGLMGSPVAGSTSVRLNWMPSVGVPALKAAQGYHLWRATTPGSEASLVSVDGPPYVDPTTAGNADYYYVLTDVDLDADESPWSLEVKVHTAPGAPTTPTFSAITMTSLTVSWNQPPGGASSYHVERALDLSGAPGTWADVGGPGGSPFGDIALTCGTTYWYRVRGLGTAGFGAYSPSAPVTTSTCPLTQILEETAGEPADGPLCPAVSGLLDAFLVKTTTNDDYLDSVTVKLPTGASSWIEKVEIIESNGTLYGSLGSPIADTAVVPLNTLHIHAQTTASHYKVRITAKSFAGLTTPGTFDVTGTVVDVVAENYAKELKDTKSATLTVDRKPPANAAWVSTVPGDKQVALAWTNPVDSDFKDVLLLRDTQAVVFTPTDGTGYALGTIGGNLKVVCITGTSFTETSLTNGTSYSYRLFTRDNCGNWSAGVAAGPFKPGPTIIVGDGSSVSDAPVCPGAVAVKLDEFTLKTSSGTDTVTAVTVSLKSGSAAALKRIEILDDANASKGFVDNPASDSPLIATSISVTTTSKTFRVMVTPKHWASLAAPPGKSYPVSGTVSSLACTFLQDLGDHQSATLTVDDQSPDTPPAFTTVVPDDQQIALGWNAGSANTVLVLRDEVSVAAVPVPGTSYAPGPFGASLTTTVVYAGSGTTATDQPLQNGKAYYYAIFGADACHNYTSGTTSGPHTPAGVVTLVGDGQSLPDANLCPGDSATAADNFTLRTTSTTDNVTGFTVALAPGVGGSLESVEVGPKAGAALGSGTPVVGSDSVSVMLASPLAIGTGETALEIRVVPKARAALTTPGKWAITAKVAHVTGVVSESINDTTSATLTLLGQPPAAPTIVSAVPTPSRVTLSWTVPADAAGILLVRDTVNTFTPPTLGATYTPGAALGTGSVIDVGADMSKIDGGLTDGTPYFYALYAYDTCHAYSAAALAGPLIPGPATLLIGEASDPPENTICPGASITTLDAFTLSTTRDTDTVSELTLYFLTGTAAGLTRVEVASKDGATVYGVSLDPNNDTVVVTLAPPLAVDTTPVAYQIRVAPKSLAELLQAGVTQLEIGDRIGGAKATLPVSVGDAVSGKVIVDLQAPATPTNAGAVVDSDAVRLAWTNPASDFESAIVLRGVDPLTDVPVTGASYQAGDTLGASTVIYAGAESSWRDPSPPAGAVWAIFARDNCGNYSSGAVVSAPAPDAGEGLPPVYNLGGCGCSQVAAPTALLALLGLALLRRRRP